MDDKIYAGSKVVFANGEKYTLTNHAIHRILSRTVTKEEIAEAIEYPKRTNEYKRDDGTTVISILGKNFVKLIVSKDNIIITVVKTSKEYTASKIKARRNNRSVKDKKQYGNRSRNN